MVNDFEIGPLTPASEHIIEDMTDPVTQACPRCGIRLQDIPADIVHVDDRPTYDDHEIMWFELETLPGVQHSDARCYRQRRVRDENSKDLAEWLVKTNDATRVRLGDEDGPETVAAVARAKAEQAVAREYLHALMLKDDAHPERPEGFTEGVRWAMHMLAQGHRYDSGWQREWNADYIARADNSAP